MDELIAKLAGMFSQEEIETAIRNSEQDRRLAKLTAPNEELSPNGIPSDTENPVCFIGMAKHVARMTDGNEVVAYFDALTEDQLNFAVVASVALSETIKRYYAHYLAVTDMLGIGVAEITLFGHGIAYRLGILEKERLIEAATGFRKFVDG